MGATYSMGAATVGIQVSTVDTAAAAEEENDCIQYYLSQ